MIDLTDKTTWDLSTCQCAECHPSKRGSDDFTPYRWLLFGAGVWVTAATAYYLGS